MRAAVSKVRAEDAFLGPQVRAAAVGEDLVLLHIDRDAYACQPGAGARLSADRRRLTGLDPASCAALAEDGFLAQAWTPARAPPAPPRRGLPEPAGAWGLGETASVAAACLAVVTGYAGRPFAELVRETPRAGPAAPAPEALRLAAAFRDLAPWAPLSGKCLVRSFVLRRLLARRGHPCDWVFGVRLWPFAAHCWLQAGEVALDDIPERLAPYTPILVV